MRRRQLCGCRMSEVMNGRRRGDAHRRRTLDRDGGPRRLPPAGVRPDGSCGTRARRAAARGEVPDAVGAGRGAGSGAPVPEPRRRLRRVRRRTGGGGGGAAVEGSARLSRGRNCGPANLLQIVLLPPLAATGRHRPGVAWGTGGPEFRSRRRDRQKPRKRAALFRPDVAARRARSTHLLLIYHYRRLSAQLVRPRLRPSNVLDVEEVDEPCWLPVCDAGRAKKEAGLLDDPPPARRAARRRPRMTGNDDEEPSDDGAAHVRADPVKRAADPPPADGNARALSAG